MSRMEKEHNRREDMLKQEISDLQQVLISYKKYVDADTI